MIFKNFTTALFTPTVLIAGSGYLVDMFDLFAFNMLRVKSLQALGTLAKYTTLKIDEENIGDALKNGLASATETIV